MERVAVNLAEAFADEGHEAHLIYFKPKGKKLTPNEQVKLHLFDLAKTAKMTLVGAVLLMLAKLLNIFFRGSFFFISGFVYSLVFRYKLARLEKDYGRFDLIIMRGHGTFEAVWNIRDNRVVQMVESVFIRDKNWIDKLYIKSVYSAKNLAGVSTEVVQKIQEVSQKFGVKYKSLHKIYNPIDRKSIEEKSLAYAPEMNEEYIVSVGRVTPNKNISFLLESYHLARTQYAFDKALVIVGDGHDMSTIKAKIEELGLEKDVFLLGLLENPYPWIKKAKLLTSTSFAEGFGMVILEALVLQTPVLSTQSRGGVKDIMVDELRNNMVVFDAELFAQKMVMLANDAHRAFNFDKYVTPFEAKNITQKYLSLYL